MALGLLALPVSAGTTVTNRRVARGQILTQALRAASLEPREVEGVIKALEGVLDFRRCREGDQLRIVREAGGLVFFDYRQSAVDEWQVRREGAQFVAAKREVEVEKRIAVVDLTVESSLYEAALTAREDPLVAMALSDVFAWDIDFYSDVRRGDHVRAVVEKFMAHGRLLRYGEVLAANYQGESVGKKRVYRYAFENGDVSYFQEDGSSARKSFLKSPLKYAHVTSSFGSRFHPVLQYVKNHNGVDYGTPVGTPVWAVADGTVTKALQDSAAGKHVCLRHMNGFETCYLHLSGFGPGVRLGAHVSQKQIIAYSGNSGLSTGPHLHFGMKRGGVYINPLNQKFPRADPLPHELLADFKWKTAGWTNQLDAVPVAAKRGR